MALVFHDVHGCNVELSDDKLTAKRVNAQNNSDGVLFSSRPLQVGESLEVQLDGLTPLIQGGGLEIGVTDLDPATLTLERTATDLKIGHTVILSGWSVALNGKQIEMLKQNAHSIEPGEKLAVRLDVNSVEIILFGECVTRVNVKGWKQVYVVVDLYGKADAVSITSTTISAKSTSNLDKTKKEIKSMLEKMEEKKREDFKAVWVTVKTTSEYYRKFLREKALKEQAAGYMASLQGGKIITAYIKEVTEWAKHDTLNSQLDIDIRVMCMRYCDYSHELANQFGEAGLLEICTRDLRNLFYTYKQSEAARTMISSAFGILHNCAKLEANIPRLRSYDFVSAAQPYTNLKNNARDIVIEAAVTISYVMEKSQADIARLSEATMSALLDRLRKALQEETHQCDGWQAYELCLGLAKLAADSLNLRNAVQLGGHGLFGRLLVLAIDDQERLAALHALDAHICPNSCRAIAGQKDMMALLTTTKEKGSATVKEKASDVFEKLTSLVKEREELKGPRTAESSMPGVRRSLGVSGAMVQRHQEGGGEEYIPTSNATPLPVTPMPAAPASSSCPYRTLCTDFFNQGLKLNAEFFNPAFNVCYCKNCHRERKDEDYYQRGSPPKLYGLPIGWCRFALLLPPRAKALDVSKKWHRAFHGTRKTHLPKILEVGELAIPGRDVVGNHRVKEQPGHFHEGHKPDGFDTKNIFLSPSIRYAGYEAYATPIRWRNGEKRYTAKVAFQVFICPDSYEVGPETIGAPRQIDHKFSNREIEWFTNHQGSTILYGLLIKLSEE